MTSSTTADASSSSFETKPPGSDLHAVLYRMVTPDHLCPFGIKAKDLLERRGYDVDDRHLKTHEESAAFKREHGVETTPQVFIGEERVGGYDDLRVFFDLDPTDSGGPDYQPIIALFAVTLAMAFATSWAIEGTLASVRTIELFVAFSMCVLAILKLRDLDSFSNQFVTYDLLARRIVRYAYVYPFVEALAGVGMIARWPVPLIALGALFIGSVGAVSVFKAVYIDKRELKCACVGGDSNVPLGFVSLTENLMMIAMALWMGGRAAFAA